MPAGLSSHLDGPPDLHHQRIHLPVDLLLLGVRVHLAALDLHQPGCQAVAGLNDLLQALTQCTKHLRAHIQTCHKPETAAVYSW